MFSGIFSSIHIVFLSYFWPKNDSGDYTLQDKKHPKFQDGLTGYMGRYQGINSTEIHFRGVNCIKK